MEFSIQEILKKRLEASKSNTLERQFILEGKEYNKKYSEGVKCFQKKINEDRKKEKIPELSFIAIRQKLLGIKEIDDLRWFYRLCLSYEKKRNKFGQRIPGNTFNKCFFGALKI